MIKNKIFTTLLAALLLCILLAGGVIFIYRFNIIRYSAETLIRKALPGYVSIDTISFDFQNSKAAFAGFRILNPQGFSNKYLVEIEEVSCRYKMKGKTILDGLEIFEPVFKRPVMVIERLGDGRVNLQEMGKVVGQDQGSAPKVDSAPEAQKAGGEGAKADKGPRLPDLLKIPENFTVKEGKLIFLDKMVRPKEKVITFENISAGLTLVLDPSYSQVRNVATKGSGYLNGNQTERIQWTIAFDPKTAKLTMSNRFEVSGVEIKAFEPYYDRYSPFIFQSGRFSGLLIFDFDNGNIGSTNEIHLSGLAFSIKPGNENAQFWQVSVPDIAKYFTSSFGDIVFDFKIKGEMARPQFFLGPISKQAITAMAIDKISQAIMKASTTAAEQSGGAQAGSGDNVSDYVDLIKGLMKKK